MAKKTSIEADLSPFAKSLIETVVSNRPTKVAKSVKKGSGNIQMMMNYPSFDDTLNVLEAAEFKKLEEELNKKVASSSPLVKSVLNVLNGPGKVSIERLAFETDPSQHNIYQSVYRVKLRLLPDDILKRISIQDDLVASIANARCNQVAVFGRPQPDRFGTGFKIEAEPGYMEKLDKEEKKKLQEKIRKAELRLLNCGSTTGWSDKEALTFNQFLFISARNAVIFGRTATEIIFKKTMDGNREFHSFRPIDAGTIYQASPQREAVESVRQEARKLLEQLKNRKLEPEKFANDEYAWVQVVHGRPVQAFTPDECLVHNFYPVSDVELDGYPLTPIDTMIAAVTTHINITNHNKLYFQSGRAARGMIVIKSDDVDEGVISKIRQQFNASINSVANAWRMPIFGVGSDDEIGWYPIDNSSRDMEFQYLSDTNARVILSAFQMSPEELPGYAHLSRGTNNQALSESNNEYKLEAHRDVGIRPLVGQFQNFINSRIFPLIDEELAKICTIKFSGLDVDTAEKEAIRLQQDMGIHMTMDDVLERVEKKPLGKKFGGKFILNPQWQAVLDKYVPVGVIMEEFFEVPGASKDPLYAYLRDPFYFTQVQNLMQQQQLQQQAEQAKQAAAQGQPLPGQEGPPSDSGGDGGPAKSREQHGADREQVKEQGEQGGSDQSAGDQGQDLTRSIDQMIGLLSKSENQLPPSKRRLIAQQRKLVTSALEAWEKDSQDTLKEITDIALKHLPRK